MSERQAPGNCQVPAAQARLRRPSTSMGRVMESLILGLVTITFGGAGLGVCLWLASKASFYNAMILGQAIFIAVVFMSGLDVNILSFVPSAIVIAVLLNLQMQADERDAHKRAGHLADKIRHRPE